MSVLLIEILTKIMVLLLTNVYYLLVVALLVVLAVKPLGAGMNQNP